MFQIRQRIYSYITQPSSTMRTSTRQPPIPSLRYPLSGNAFTPSTAGSCDSDVAIDGGYVNEYALAFSLSWRSDADRCSASLATSWPYRCAI